MERMRSIALLAATRKDRAGGLKASESGMAAFMAAAVSGASGWRRSGCAAGGEASARVAAAGRSAAAAAAVAGRVSLPAGMQEAVIASSPTAPALRLMALRFAPDFNMLRRVP